MVAAICARGAARYAERVWAVFKSLAWMSSFGEVTLCNNSFALAGEGVVPEQANEVEENKAEI